MRRLFSFLLLSSAALITLPAAAAVLSVEARVSKQTVALNGQLVLSVTVKGPQAALPEPRMPQLPNFSIYSSGRSQNISFTNGRVTSAIVHTYVLSPHFVGKGSIGPITVKVGGKTVSTPPIEITVIPPDGPGASPTGGAARASRAAPAVRRTRPQPQKKSRKYPSLFVTAEVDKNNPYVNEQVTLTVKFHTSVPLLGNPQYTTPKIAGFLAEDLPPERHGNIPLEGRDYYFSEIKTALFPVQAGPLTIGAATVRCHVQREISVDPLSRDFFENFFSQGLVGRKAVDIRSEPLMIKARPLPAEGKPADFTGAVGRFTIRAVVDNPAPKVGEAITLTLTVAGEGDLKSFGKPPLPKMPHMRLYETLSSLNLNKKNDRVQGSKVFTTVMVPKVSGTSSIPSLSISYFDPRKGKYVRASSRPIELHVTPGDGKEEILQTTAGRASNRGLTAVANDIRYLKKDSGRGPLAAAIGTIIAAGPLHAIPFIFFGLALGMTQYRDRWASDPKGAKFHSALSTAMSRIRGAGKDADPQKGTALLGDALSGFLADKLGEPSSGLTQRHALDLLRKKAALTEEHLEKIKELWEEIDLRRFAPSATPKSRRKGPDEKLIESLRALLKNLDKEIVKS